ncbi:MAG: hypothetical protein Q4F84_04170, partial [Fibrobacter sp.]|nr:hypothetical protein [Fibrobacter sp.]
KSNISYEEIPSNKNGTLEKYSAETGEEMILITIRNAFVPISSGFLHGQKYNVSEILQLGNSQIERIEENNRIIVRCIVTIQNTD